MLYYVSPLPMPLPRRANIYSNVIHTLSANFQCRTTGPLLPAEPVRVCVRTRRASGGCTGGGGRVGLCGLAGGSGGELSLGPRKRVGKQTVSWGSSSESEEDLGVNHNCSLTP